jgi:hypothetical protein
MGIRKMKAYKVFNPDWTCKGFQYKVGETYSIQGDPLLCKRGFHACKKAADCFNYYSFSPDNKIAEVSLDGMVAGENDDKQCTNMITIVREISWGELLELVNTGSGNSGYQNSGNLNSGNLNSGDRNSGNLNSGNLNSGNLNSGNLNSGNLNSGNLNSGDQNSGNRNSGNLNSGNLNSGNLNSGDQNSGNRNSGDQNSGDLNSGYLNSGDLNSGDLNSGYLNSGDLNSGDLNSGYLNSDTPTVRMFNKDTGKRWDEISIPSFLYFDFCVWVSHDTASDEEKVMYKKEIEVSGGFLKTLKYKEAFQLAWNKASEKEHAEVKALPNFDADIFFEISGIKV